MRLRHLLPLLLALAALVPSSASAASLKRVASGFDRLTQVTAPRAGDRSGVLYMVEQEGQVWRRYRGRNRLFLDIRRSVGTQGGEQGLLSLAFDPGLIVGSAISGWSISIHAGTSSLLLAEQQPIRPPANISMLAVMGSDAPLSSVPAPAPMAISATVAEGYGNTTWPIGLIDPGETARIRIEAGAISVPGSWE